MDLILTHMTALEVVRWANFSKYLVRGETCAAQVPTKMPSPSELDEASRYCDPLAKARTPINVLIAGANGCHASERIKPHVFGTVPPPGSFVEIASGVRCVSPALLAVQMATTCTHYELVLLLDELLGTYAIQPAARQGMASRRTPVLTLEKLERFLGDLVGYPGTSKVRRALADVKVNSASPMESKISTRLGVAHARGGYRLDVLELNKPLEVQRIEGELVIGGVRKPDILLADPTLAPAGAPPFRGVALDYNGEVHEGRMAMDVRRQNELLAYGLKGYGLDKSGYDDLGYMDWLVGVIRRDLGLPPRKCSKERLARERAAHKQLHDELERIDGLHFGSSVPG